MIGAIPPWYTARRASYVNFARPPGEHAETDPTMAADETLPLPPVPLPDDRPHIHVINSDEMFLEMMADLLADTRAHVTLEQMRPNLAVTVGNLRAARPDLLLLDVVPFRTEAATLLDLLERDADLRDLPILLASTSPDIAERLAAAHPTLVRDILPKPFDLEAFYAKLHRLAGIAVH